MLPLRTFFLPFSLLISFILVILCLNKYSLYIFVLEYDTKITQK
nr:MAG TPA: hypothetical protein [Caudoviricetes sp.]